jgi:plastocyanin
MRTTQTLLLAGGGLALALALNGCGYSAPTAADPGPQGATVTITSSGVDPRTVTIAYGQSVTFVNEDSVAHEMASDPQPTNDACPSINRVGHLEPGQSTQTGAFPVSRTCAYHDVLAAGDARWQGTIVVQ